MRKTIAIAAASLMLAPAALAADFTPPPPMPVVVAPAPAGFPWAGAYWGVFAGYHTLLNFGQTGMQSGYNFVRGRLLAGAEVETTHLNPVGAIVDASLVGRLGFLINDRLLVYGQAGLGTVIVAPVVSVGGGVEFALRNSLSVFAEARVNFTIPGFGYFGTEIRAGVNFHAGAAGGGGGATDPWSGLYLGGIGAYDTILALAETGVQVGYNFHPGRLVVGVEAQTSISVATIVNASLGARVGFAVGDRSLVYGKVAIGSNFVVPILSFGGGIEMAMANGEVSVFAVVERLRVLGGGPFGTRLNAGINLHFGN